MGAAVEQRTLLMHQIMLGDRVRLEAYDEALRRAVRPGDVVVDVGAGTLALSLMALRHGAAHVYAIEGDPETAALAAAVAEHNRLHGRLTVVQGDARSTVLPCDVDVIVSEMMGNLGPEEEMTEILGAVAGRHLAAGGRVVPRRLRTMLKPVQLDAEGWGVWTDDFFGASLEVVQQFAAPAPQLHFFAREPAALGRPVAAIDSILGVDSGVCPRTVELPIERRGVLHAVIGYFDATLFEDHSLANHPGYPGCNWAVWVWPVRHTRVEPGAVLEVALHRPETVRDALQWRLDCKLASASAPLQPRPAFA